MTQLQEAPQCRYWRDQAILGKGLESLRILYEQTLADYKEQYNEEPWLIIAKEGARER